MKKINILGLISMASFAFALTYNIHFGDNPYGYLSIFILYAFETIRSYTEGLERGVEIIKEIVESK